MNKDWVEGDTLENEGWVFLVSKNVLNLNVAGLCS